MTKVNVTKTINVTANDAWNKLSSFRGVEDFSPIEKSVVEGEGEGATRTCTMPDGAEINEVLSFVDNDNMYFEYKIITGPFPFTNYLSKVKVKSIDDNNCEISWGCTFDADAAVEQDMINLLEGFYNTMIDGVGNLINA